MGIDERNQLVQNLILSFNCLKGKHMSKDCRKPQVCTVPDCTVKHHSLLHRWVTEKDHIATQPSVSCAATNNAFSKSCLGIIPVVVKGNNGNTCRTYALLDVGTEDALRRTFAEFITNFQQTSDIPNVNCELHEQYRLRTGG